MLGGEYRHALDQKNRIFTPAKLREELGSSFVVSKALRDKCLKVYSNQDTVALYANGKKLAEQTGRKVFTFQLPLAGEVEVKAVAGDCIDTAVFRQVDQPNPSYKLVKTKSKSANWV